MKFEVGTQVTWVSSNTRKNGIITDIVPAGKTPADVGRPRAGGGGVSRDHETYVVHGWKLNHRGEPYGSKTYYWPHVSLLERLL